MRKIDGYPKLLDFQAWLTQKILDRKMSQPGKMAMDAETARDSRLSVNTVNVICNGDSCPYCLEAHNLESCEKFCKLDSPDERLSFAREKRMCYKCLRSGHLGSGCPAPKTTLR